MSHSDRERVTDSEPVAGPSRVARKETVSVSSYFYRKPYTGKGGSSCWVAGYFIESSKSKSIYFSSVLYNGYSYIHFTLHNYVR